ncbi:DNA-3-methyladenine glycosylase [Savagea sp. SN6]|uniref:Putative 3-methyladenine DNA glycosylase n=1 Tax=Savagea serpentis TaxID=2785297 RepID=A0A8J7KCP9_9BACL|nr:DNA-3-methyladenine glycosylase [Savagea serpentis]MBF4501757.1 DNA-3-methyladenine glycosylase [Savagea serpentis]
MLQRSFYERPVIQVARELIGCYLVREIDGETLVGKIVETEAYAGPLDRAAHSYSNRPTERTKAMFQEAGHAYIYEMHTHALLNVVTGRVGQPHGVLIRAVEPIAGLEVMKQNRATVKRQIDWTNGPGKLTKAFHITKALYAHPLNERPLYIEEGEKGVKIARSPRVGIANSGRAADYPWRFFERGNPYVSTFRK